MAEFAGLVGKKHLSGESAEEGVSDVTESERKVLVEEILEELAHSQVRPATVDNITDARGMQTSPERNRSRERGLHDH